MSVVIDLVFSNKIVDLDDKGWYLVKLWFNKIDCQDGVGLVCICMVLGYVGMVMEEDGMVKIYGMYVFLYKGVEVLLLFEGGDFDWLVIMLVVVNFENFNVVNQKNFI